MKKRNKNVKKTVKPAQPPTPTKEQLDRVDALLRCWINAATGIPDGREYPGCKDRTTVYVPDALDAVIRMCETLAHCAQLVSLQEVATGRKTVAEAGEHDVCRGFVLTAMLLERIKGLDELKYKSVRPPNAKEQDSRWFRIGTTREHVKLDIERIAPGWSVTVQKAVDDEDHRLQAIKASVKPRTAACNPKDAHRPKKGFATRIARNQAKCFAKGKPSAHPKHGGFRREDFR